MVGFEGRRDSILEHGSSLETQKISDDSFTFSLPDIYDFSLPFTDSSLDFDPIKEWLEEDPPIGPPPYSMDDEFSVVNDKEKSIDMKRETCYFPTDAGVDFVPKSCEKSTENVVELSIEEELRRVSLNLEIRNGGVLGEEGIDNGVKQSAEILCIDGNGCDKDESGSESGEDIAGGEMELEEGEIMSFQPQKMVAWTWSDDDDDDDDEDGTANKGPIRFKNEIVVIDSLLQFNSFFTSITCLLISFLLRSLAFQVLFESEKSVICVMLQC